VAQVIGALLVVLLIVAFGVGLVVLSACLLAGRADRAIEESKPCE
jgi:hypothetical protein